jgi:hypothetical protein
MTRRKLPIGIQTLAKLRENGCYYVDKTAFALKMIEQGSHYFLSRPRRFGKSLFLDTLGELFAGREALFQGLYIYERWNWRTRYPVIRLNFAEGVLRDRTELDAKIAELLAENEQRLGVSGDYQTLSGRFAQLIRLAHAEHGQRVVVLVDEYDKPILDNLAEPETARELRDGLRNLYSVIKATDAHVHFVFLTGVSKFSKVSLFSELNNLNDITLDADYSALCGYTETDLDTVFAPELADFDRAQIRHWYNGYNWLGEAVYNPFDVLLLFQKRQYRPWWFETGTPTFLIDLLAKHQTWLPELTEVTANEELLSAFDVPRINPIALMFQTGYLTIQRTEWLAGNLFFKLSVPNWEVRVALNNQFFIGYTRLDLDGPALQHSAIGLLARGDLNGLRELLFRLFAAIPYRNFTACDLPAFEGYYASVLYAFFSSLGLEVIPEDISNRGQADLTVKGLGHVYVMEIKVVTSETITGNPALTQVIARGYADKYRHLPNHQIHQIGLVFSSQPQIRNLIAFDEAS